MKAIDWLKKQFLRMLKSYGTRALKFYGRGFLEVISIAVLIVIGVLIYNASQPIDKILSLFIPQEYLFPASGFVFLFVIAPLILATLDKLGLRKLFNRFFSRIPVVNLLFVEDEGKFQQGIPVAVKVLTGYSYGILRGWSEIYGDTDFAGGNLWLSVFIPSSPTPFTSVLVPSSFKPEDVDEFEIVGNTGRNRALAAIIQRECLHFGQPPSSKIRLMKLDLNEVKRLPALSGEDKQQFSQEISKSTE
ncbi:hypothetical protein ES703_34893 [subsurface metagenome]